MKALHCPSQALALLICVLALSACNKKEEAAAPAAAPASAPAAAAAASASGQGTASAEAGNSDEQSHEIRSGGSESPAVALQPVQPPTATQDSGVGDPNQRRMAIIAAAWGDLKPANIAFNLPPALRVHEKTTVEFLLSFELSVADLQARITAPGKVQIEGIGAGPNMRMRVHLQGDDFNINPIEPETHDALLKQLNRWSWAISPKTSGDLPLHLTVEVLPVEGDFAVKTYDGIIHVKVSLWEWLKDFIANNWKWLWTTIAGPLLVWWWQHRKTSAPPAEPAHGNPIDQGGEPR